jgi:hypothetical protein
MGRGLVTHGQVAYAAYAQATGGLNFMGHPMPEWPDLPPGIRAAWEAAAAAVCGLCETEPG